MTTSIRKAGLLQDSKDNAVGYDPCAVSLRRLEKVIISIGNALNSDRFSRELNQLFLASRDLSKVGRVDQ